MGPGTGAKKGPGGGGQGWGGEIQKGRTEGGGERGPLTLEWARKNREWVTASESNTGAQNNGEETHHGESLNGTKRKQRT